MTTQLAEFAEIGGVVARTPELMSAGRASQFLGISRDTLRQWITQGDGPPRTRKGKRYYFVREVLKDWLKTNAPSATASTLPPGREPQQSRPTSVASRATLWGSRG